MEFPIDTEMPHWMRAIIWVAVVLGAIGYIIKTVRNSGLLTTIAKELTPNSGGSVKDLVQQAAIDSREAVELTKKLAHGYHKLAKRQIALGKDHASIREQIIAERNERAAQAAAIEKKLARYIVHEAKNDLHLSNLLKEEERLLQEEDQKASDQS